MEALTWTDRMRRTISSGVNFPIAKDTKLTDDSYTASSFEKSRVVNV
jgi:hypothetical protein